ncbi:MAG: CDGSH iron-sulfur domain-containing protein [Actinomycetota bacterium]
MSERAVEIVRGGPILVRGLALRRISGQVLGPDLAPGATFSLCRCGRSSTMPFCEREAPYRCFEEAAPTRELEKLPTWDVPDPAIACVALKANGPVRVSGDVETIGADGERVPANAGRRSLCRCGASACQPMCDGSHKVAPIVDPPVGS